ncbi:PREDICTED: solute carrier family 22 member 15-like, partial [Acropora digitifera]|uniref:solute carrier family 22 member 15-like n=1 Tax=Acropora digitifera TaxID=70779 RepID=UPI00077A1FB0
LNNFYGRKRAWIFCLALPAIFCVIYSAILPSSDAEKGVATAFRITLAVLEKFCINASFSTIYVFSTERLPTVIRNVGMGSMAVFDQTGASVAPFVVLLGKTHDSICGNEWIRFHSGLPLRFATRNSRKTNAGDVY